MKTVKRDDNGNITHVRIETEFFTKADADLINFSDVNVPEFIRRTKATKMDLEVLLHNVLNERTTIAQARIHVLKTLGLIEDKPLITIGNKTLKQS